MLNHHRNPLCPPTSFLGTEHSFMAIKILAATLSELLARPWHQHNQYSKCCFSPSCVPYFPSLMRTALPYALGSSWVCYVHLMSFPVSISPSQSPASEKLCCPTPSLPACLCPSQSRAAGDLRGPRLAPLSGEAQVCRTLLCSLSLPSPLREDAPSARNHFRKAMAPFPRPLLGSVSQSPLVDSDSAQSVTVPWLPSGPQTPLGRGLGCSVPEGKCRHSSGVAGGGGFTLEPCPRATTAASALDFPPWGTLPHGAPDGQTLPIWQIFSWVREYFKETHVEGNS